MAVEPISGLPAAGTITGSELLAIVQGGVTCQATITAILAIIIPTDFDETQTISGTTMTLTHTPFFVYGIYNFGQRLIKGVDYTVSSNTVTFLYSLSSATITAVYKY